VRLRLLPIALAISISPVTVYADGVAEADERPAVEDLPDHDHHLGWDIAAMGRQSGLGFVSQFAEFDSWILIAGLADITFLLSLNEAAVQRSIEDAHVMGDAGELIADVMGIAANCGVAPLGAYAIGRLTDDDKAVHFGIELAATQLIVSVEVILVSQIPFHKRPVIEKGDRPDEDASFLNDALRGRSSYPSGHMIGLSTLVFKGWEHYGWKVGLPATIATVFVGWARVQAGEHYLTDIVGTVGLAGIASLAVTRVRDFWPHTRVGSGRSAKLFAFPVLNPSRGTLTVVGLF
jgi:membrane-associated phospholipid phosphatase